MVLNILWSVLTLKATSLTNVQLVYRDRPWKKENYTTLSYQILGQNILSYEDSNFLFPYDSETQDHYDSNDSFNEPWKIRLIKGISKQNVDHFYLSAVSNI